ncbi:MAG: hypothetical protein ABSD51_14460, partial [Candidatus Binatus sp.]
ASNQTDRALAERLLEPRARNEIDRRAKQRQRHDQSDERNRNRMIHRLAAVEELVLNPCSLSIAAKIKSAKSAALI